MPFKPKTFEASASTYLSGDLLEDLVDRARAYEGLTTPRQKAGCVGALMAALDQAVDEVTRQAIMQACGRACLGASTLERARRLARGAEDIDDLLAQMNAAHLGGGHLRREGDVIHAAYDRCYCGSVSKTRAPISPTYCQCSCGWFQQLFEGLLGQPVEVVLDRSVIRGAPRCEFRILL